MLNNHAPIISILEKGHIKVVDNNNEEKLIEICDMLMEEGDFLLDDMLRE